MGKKAYKIKLALGLNKLIQEEVIVYNIRLTNRVKLRLACVCLLDTYQPLSKFFVFREKPITRMNL